MRAQICLLALVLLSCKDNKVDESGKVFDESFIHQIAITVPEDQVSQLSTSNDTRIPCTFTFDGVTLTDVGVRLKTGAGSRREITEKAGFSIKFNEFVQGQELFDVKKLTIGNAVEDDSRVSEHLAYEVFRRAGIPAPRTAYAEVTFNGELFGLYVIRESVDKTFLKRNFDDASGNLYEGNIGIDITNPNISLENNEEIGDTSDAEALADVVFNTPDGQFTDAVDSLVDLDQFFTYWAVEAMVYHWDGYAVIEDDFGCCSPNNYFVYHEPARDKFIWLPHGADMTFGLHRIELNEVNTPAISAPGSNALFAGRLFQQAGTQERLAAAIEEVLAGPWDTEFLLNRLDTMADLVRSTGLRGSREEITIDDFEAELAIHRDFVERRAAIVQQQLP
jgi:spore coat protein H